MQKILDERWGGKHTDSSNWRIGSGGSEKSGIHHWKSIRDIHHRLQVVCGHRGVGRDSSHIDNRKGPSVEATFLFRQLEKAYTDAAAAGFRFPPPEATRDGKVR